MLPVIADMALLLKRLSEEDQVLSLLLSDLEECLRKFESKDRPAYERWVRLELGPALMTLEEVMNQIHQRRILVHQVNYLVQNENFRPREALYAAMAHAVSDTREGANDEPANLEDENPFEDSDPSSNQNWDPEEIAARRRAKLESKRAERRQNKRNQKNQSKQSAENSGLGRQEGGVEQGNAPKKVSSLVSLYRMLARKLHPDSPLLVKEMPLSQSLALWHEVQTAYDENNLDRLVSISTWIGDSNLKPLTLSDRFERIRSMKRSVTRLERSLHQSRLHPGWEFRPSRKLLKSAARNLEDEISRTQEVLDSLNDFIDSIGSPRARRKAESKRKRE